jgi:RNA polymerase sigma-70 factor (ECF subfamily)
VRAFRALSGFDMQRSFVTWLLAIATNVARRYLQRRRKTVALADIDVAGPADEASAYEREEGLEVLKTAVAEGIDRLSEVKRRALVLLHRDRRSYTEIAEIMDVPIGTVKTAIHRARMEIRELLRDRDLL